MDIDVNCVASMQIGKGWSFNTINNELYCLKKIKKVVSILHHNLLVPFLSHNESLTRDHTLQQLTTNTIGSFIELHNTNPLTVMHCLAARQSSVQTLTSTYRSSRTSTYIVAVKSPSCWLRWCKSIGTGYSKHFFNHERTAGALLHVQPTWTVFSNTLPALHAGLLH